MRAIFGLLLVMLGLAMAILWMPEHNGERQLAVVTDIATKGIGSPRDRAFNADDKSARTFSPQTPLLATVEPPGHRGPQHTVAVARVVQSSQIQPDSTSATVVARSTPHTLNAAVLPAPSAGTLTSTVMPAVRTLDTAPPATTPLSVEMRRDELVRGIQRELKRVGCYYGEIDGDWGTGSKRAMSTFTDRVNASLPVDQPDFILLALLRGHTGTACGKGCPSGQSMNDGGRCVASTVVAQIVPRIPETRSATRDPARMAVVAAAERLPPAAATPRTAAAVGAWSTTVQREAITAVPLPAPVVVARPVVPQQSTTLPATTITQTIAPLPGRMAIGGPAAGAAYVATPPERQLAREAVRPELEPEPIARAVPRERQRRTARRSPYAAPAYAYRYPVPAVSVYRAPRFAYAAPRRTRSWTGAFFGTP